jgi:hypothetical protein
MYQLSRSLYRELAPLLPGSVDSLNGEGRRDRHYLLETCESSVRRLVMEPDSCRTPARSLFREIRHLFAVDAQEDVWRVVRVHVDAGQVLADRMRQTLRRECQAITRGGTPCRREPPAGRQYCPSHYRLAEDLQLETQPVAAAV